MKATITTDAEILALAPTHKAYKRFCGGGLYVRVSPTGARSFRFGYKVDGVPRTHTFGLHGPDLPLAAVRKALERVKDDLAHNVDPREQREEVRGRDGQRFEAEARLWLEKRRAHVSAGYADQVLRNLERDVFPHLGRKRLEDIDTPAVVKVCQRVEMRGALDVARDIRMWISMVFVHAMHAGRAKFDPAHSVEKALQKRTRTHFDSIQPGDIPRLLADLRAFDCEATTKLQLRLMMHLVPRPSVVRHLRWDWIDRKANLIRVPAAVNGMKHVKEAPKSEADYLIPLSKPALALLDELATHTGKGELCFPHRSRHWEPQSNNTLLMALKRMGWNGALPKDDPQFRPNVTVHGFRATFMTTCLQRFAKTRPQELALDVQLDHVIPDAVRAAYLRDEHGTHRGLLIDERREIMRQWSAFLVKCETAKPAKVVKRPTRNSAKGGRAAQAMRLTPTRRTHSKTSAVSV